MFSFHKPKVYRSSTGCCICKAKSSSSRFTDSKKYEDDFMKCFQLEERRTGEICNACVLLVKRWKKLPVGSGRNWRHVVDARAGPGIKSLTKFKAKNKKKMKEVTEKFDKIMKKKHVYLKNDGEREESPTMSDDTEEYTAGSGSKGSSRAGTPEENDELRAAGKRLTMEVDEKEDEFSSFIDLTYFKRTKICCGVIFKGLCGEVIIEPSLLKPCSPCLAQRQRRQEAIVLGSSPSHSSASASPTHSSASTSPAHSVDSSTDSTVSKASSKMFCDSSSDSGYDDVSSLGASERKLASKLIPNPSAIVKPAVKIQTIKNTLQKTDSLSEAVRLKADGQIKFASMKPVDQMMCKSMSLVTSANLALSNSTSHPIGAVPARPLVDFAMHTQSRQSIAN